MKEFTGSDDACPEEGQVENVRAQTTQGVSAERIAAWRILVRVLQARYHIPGERVHAHDWIDTKDARDREGCDLATLRAASHFGAAIKARLAGEG